MNRCPHLTDDADRQPWSMYTATLVPTSRVHTVYCRGQVSGPNAYRIPAIKRGDPPLCRRTCRRRRSCSCWSGQTDNSQLDWLDQVVWRIGPIWPHANRNPRVADTGHQPGRGTLWAAVRCTETSGLWQHVLQDSIGGIAITEDMGQPFVIGGVCDLLALENRCARCAAQAE